MGANHTPCHTVSVILLLTPSSPLYAVPVPKNIPLRDVLSPNSFVILLGNLRSIANGIGLGPPEQTGTNSVTGDCKPFLGLS